MKTPTRALSLTASTALAASGGLHLIALKRHLDVSPAVAGFFLVTAVAQIFGAWRLANGPGRRFAATTVLGTLVLLGLWVISRTVGVPMSGEGVEAVGRLDVATAVLELATVALLVPLVAARALASRTATWSRLASGAAIVSVTLLASAGAAVGLPADDHHSAPHAPHAPADAADGHSHP